MRHWTPLDVIVGMLTVSVAAILLVAIVDSVVNDDLMTDAGAKRISALITSIVAIISMYVGAHIQKNRDNDKR